MTSAIVVGSGPNGLAAALTLASEGVEVTVLEAADTLGGGTRSSELTLPGLLHDECSAAHPLAVDTPFSRRFDLHAHGLTWRWPEVQYAHPLDGGAGAAAYRSVDETAVAFGKDGRAWRSVFGALAERFDDITADFLRPMLHVPEHPVKLTRFGLYSALPAAVLARRWSTEEARALFAGVAAHAFRPFGSPMSSAIGVALGTAAHRYGWPVAEGGSGSISARDDHRCSRVPAHGSRPASGCSRSTSSTGRTSSCSTSAPGSGGPDRRRAHAAPDRARPSRYRHGPGTFKVDFAVEGGVPWAYEPARAAGTVHVGGSLREIAANEKLVHAGHMPEAPFVLVCQQYLADRRRSQGDVHPVYSYAHVPAGYTGDATAQIEAQIERFAPGFRDRILARASGRVAQTEAHNANYVGGDVVTGSNDPLQLVFRPRVAIDPYSTGIPGDLHLLRGHAPRSRRPRHVRLQRRPVGAPANRPPPGRLQRRRPSIPAARGGLAAAVAALR